MIAYGFTRYRVQTSFTFHRHMIAFGFWHLWFMFLPK